MHPKSLNPAFPYESIIPTYIRYSRAVLSKFVCACLIFKIIFFLFARTAHETVGVVDIFHARCVILKMSVYSLVIAREYGKGIRDAQSQNEK